MVLWLCSLLRGFGQVQQVKNPVNVPVAAVVVRLVLWVPIIQLQVQLLFI